MKHIYTGFSAAFFLMSTLCVSCIQWKSGASSSTPKIVSGSLVEDSDPVYLATVSLDWNGTPVCTGFVFDKRSIVTAAHCLATLPPNVAFTVTFGSQNRALKKSVKVAKYALHEAWDKSDLNRSDIDPLPKNPKNDIGVIVLQEDYPEWIKPLPIKEIGAVNVDAKVILAGYGRTDMQVLETPSSIPPEPRGFLRKTGARISVVNDAGWEFVENAPQDNPYSSSCHGDSGGPMFYAENDGSLTVIGVTSRAYSKELDCKGTAVYTDVRKFVSWIRKTRDALQSQITDPTKWQHRYFEANDGTRLNLDFQLEEYGLEKTAKEIWINVYNQSLSGTENISINLSSYINSFVQQKLKLQFTNDHRFTGKLDKFEGQVVCSPVSRWGVQQDIEVFINEKALLEKNSQNSEFKFKFCE